MTSFPRKVGAALMSAALFLIPVTASSEAMKGLGIPQKVESADELVLKLHAQGYYYWSSTPQGRVENYVTMVWNAKSVESLHLPPGAKALLLFKETDHEGQADMQPQQALHLSKNLSSNTQSSFWPSSTSVPGRFVVAAGYGRS